MVGINDKDLFLAVLGARKSEIKVLACFVSDEDLLPDSYIGYKLKDCSYFLNGTLMN